MNRIYLLFVIFLVNPFFFLAQESDIIEENESLFFVPEIMIGKTLEANDQFPETTLQSGILLSIGKYNFNATDEWAARLNFPKTGFTIGYTDFGNSNNIGQAISLLPFAEFNLLSRFYINVGMGASYMNTLYNVDTNPFNRAITTHLNWSFRSFAYYDVVETLHTNWRFGLGYFHHSNGHTRLPNQGLNSLLASVSAQFNSKKEHELIEKPVFEKSSQTYFSARFGFGLNVLSEVFNAKKPVYTIAFSAGKIINRTFKIGGGFYYRYYQHYYDYISNEEELVVEEYPEFLNNPFGYATNFGLFATTELLLGHFGFEFDLGLNIYKPAYPIDWKLNQGYEYENGQGETIVVLGELDWYYEIKRTVSSRLGLKYYLKNNNNTPRHNWFLGAHINANLGQADFTDFSFGYVYRFSNED